MFSLSLMFNVRLDPNIFDKRFFCNQRILCMSLRGVTKADILSIVIKCTAYFISYSEMCRQCFKLDERRKIKTEKHIT